MRVSRDQIVGHPLLAFFVLAFGFSWIVELVAFGVFDVPEVPGIIVAAFGPPIAGVVVTRAVEGREGVRALLRRITSWRVGWRWYALVLGVIPVLGVLSFVFLEDGTENVPAAPLVLPSYLLTVVILMFLGGGQEEPGWRGFALPRMQERLGPLDAAVLLGVLWGLWHLPLYALVSDYNSAGSGFAEIATSFLGFCVYTVALSVLMTHVFNGTGGSLLLVMLLHGAMNALFAMSPETAAASWSLTGLTVAIAVVLVVATRGRLGAGPTRRGERRAAPLSAPWPTATG